MAQSGLTPDPWQREVLESPARRVLLLCSRQAGKSRTAAALALKTALLEPPAEVLIISRALRQSAELLRKVRELYRGLQQARPRRPPPFRPVPLRQLDAADVCLGPGEQVVQQSVLQMELANGSRILSLPGSPDTIVGFSAISLLVIDEAARVPDELYRAVRPMLAVSGGKLVCLSSAYAQQGFFYHEWTQGAASWQRIRVTAQECPRISPEFLAEELAAMGRRIFDREYGCQFTGVDDAAFDPGTVARALSAPAGAEAPLF